MLVTTHSAIIPAEKCYLQNEIGTNLHLKASPLSDINKQILFERGDHLRLN